MHHDEHPAMPTGHSEPPTLTLVLPSDLSKDQILKGLVEAIGQVRTDLVGQARMFHYRAERSAAIGDTLSTARCLGRVAANENAAAAIDEEIIGLFDLWDQYDCKNSGTTKYIRDSRHREPPSVTQTASSRVSTQRHPSVPIPVHKAVTVYRDGRLLGLGRLEAAVMAVVWDADPRWLAIRAIHDRLEYPRPVTYSTVSSTVTSLCRDKRLLTRRQSHQCWKYRAAWSLNDYIGELIAALLDASPSAQTTISHALRRPIRTVPTSN